MNKWLLIDVSYLCHRAFHSTGHLSWGGNPTGVVFGFFRDLIHLQQVHQTSKVAFCFDKAPYLRKKLWPGYKVKSDDNRISLEEKQARSDLKDQISILRDAYLLDLGYKNVLWQEGYEADDVIASLVEDTLPTSDRGVVVSSDKDLYQLLAYPWVEIYNPRNNTTYTGEDFHRDYGVQPFEWAVVKAIAGCTSDNIPGVRGVGELTASRYLQSELSQTSVAYKAIGKQPKEEFQRNLALVKLPFQGTKTFQLQEDNVSKRRWLNLMKELGIKKLKPPPVFA